MPKFILGLESNRDICVDHRNRNSLDNRRSNFRVTNNDKNTKHRSKNINNTSGHRNVTEDKRTNEWIVQLQVNKKNKVLGRFPKDKLEEAAKFAELMRQKYYGEFAGADE